MVYAIQTTCQPLNLAVVIFIYPAEQENDDSVDIQAYIIADNEDNDGQDLVPIEDDKEWDMVEEVLNTFLDNDGNFKA